MIVCGVNCRKRVRPEDLRDEPAGAKAIIALPDAEVWAGTAAPMRANMRTLRDPST